MNVTHITDLYCDRDGCNHVLIDPLRD
jgi:hypothetical protein